jgi:hypothetical protein
MTIEQVKEMYGDGGTIGYVNCYDCPLEKDHHGTGYNEKCPHCKDGLENCWNAIAKYMSEKEEKEPVFEDCGCCIYDSKECDEEPCVSCKHGIALHDPRHDTTPSYYRPNGSEVPKEQDNDSVNHPSHYCNGGMECIDEMILVFGETTVADFCLCNVWKYRKRALHKNGEEDLKKADWYMNKYKELIEKRHIGVDEYVREH